jgi:hypothetical protein
VCCDTVTFLPLVLKPKLRRSRCHGELVLTPSNRTLQRTYLAEALADALADALAEADAEAEADDSH